MKVHKTKTASGNAKDKKPIPMYKDPVYIAKIRLEFIDAHNDRIRRKQVKEHNFDQI